MELLHRQLSRYAVFAVKDESEALEALQRAATSMYELPPNFTGFNEDGLLVGRHASDEGDRSDTVPWQDAGGEFEDETIHLTEFEGGLSLLTLELFDEITHMDEPLHTDNIALARHLERMANSPEASST